VTLTPDRGVTSRPVMTVARAARHVTGAFVTLLLFVVAAGLLAAVVPRVFGNRTLLIRSGSMGATAPVGSLVVVHSIPSSKVRVGTVVVLQPGLNARRALPTLHRVVAVSQSVDGPVVRTKGDANRIPDPDPHVLGPVTLSPQYVIPGLGYLVGFAGTWQGWLLMLVLPSTLLLTLALRAIWATPKTAVGDAVERAAAAELDAARSRTADTQLELVAHDAAQLLSNVRDAFGAVRVEADQLLRQAHDARQALVEARQQTDALVRERTTRGVPPRPERPPPEPTVANRMQRVRELRELAPTDPS
jgi:signal peptidase I